MIVTSQPDVACDVCGRRLLRGEQPDVFLAGGRRRMVCELCAPRASAEGWMREAEQARTLSLSPARPRQGRNPLSRWRRPSRPSSEPAPESVETSAAAAEDERDERSHEVVDSGPGEPVAGTAPVFAGAQVEPIVGVEAEVAKMDESEEVERAEVERAEVEHTEAEPVEVERAGVEPAAEEGSWRDAWMFVEE
jgi:hypothetical protein